ncbi:MAG: lipopolysaccharide heptosyltransferase II [Burkholderiales bacterium]|nr:lipopolysaccharide heptosyltransferase II [Burkholderiales bacterium]
MTKVLVVGPSWVGDTVLAQPLFALLHQKHPQLALDVLAPGWTLPLLARMPEVRRAIANPYGHGELRLGERRRLGLTLAEERYDQAIVLPNSFKSALVPFFAGIPLRTGYLGELRWGLLNDARRLDKQALPLMVERFAALAGAAGEPLMRPLPAAHLEVAETKRLAVLRKFALEPRQPVVALCPGAEYGPAKRWPAQYFAELAQRLRSRGCEVWLIGSAKDAALGADIAALSNGSCANLCGNTTLDEAIDLLASAQLAVSNDSGLMHVAAALGKPLIALYGSSSPGFTPPLSASATILKLDLPCSPCFKRVCPLGHFNCMMQLVPDRVFAAVDFDKMRP